MKPTAALSYTTEDVPGQVTSNKPDLYLKFNEDLKHYDKNSVYANSQWNFSQSKHFTVFIIESKVPRQLIIGQHLHLVKLEASPHIFFLYTVFPKILSDRS